MKPVYVINGFLESGKTEFITFTLGQPYFQIKGKTLLILCEEGENEYDAELLERSRTEIVLIPEEEDFNTSRLLELEKPPAQLTEADLSYIGRYAVAAASFSTEKVGGIPSIPKKTAVLQYLKEFI